MACSNLGIIPLHLLWPHVHRPRCLMLFSSKASTYSTSPLIPCSPRSRVTWVLVRELAAFRHYPVSIPKPPHSQRFLPRKAISPRLPEVSSHPRINTEICSTRIRLPAPSESTKVCLRTEEDLSFLSTDLVVVTPSHMANTALRRVLRDRQVAIEEAQVEPAGSQI